MSPHYAMSPAKVRNGRIACVGGAHWDHTARIAGAARLASSNPVTMTRARGGVAGNLAESMTRLGHVTELVSVVGADANGDALLDAMRTVGVDVSAVLSVPDHRTASYTAVLAGDGELVIGLADMEIYDVYDGGWAARVAPSLLDFGLWMIEANVSSDALTTLANSRTQSTMVIANAVSAAKAPRLTPILDAIDVLFAAGAEAAALTEGRVDSAEHAVSAGRKLCALGVGRVVISLGDGGAVQVEAHGTRALPAIAAEVRTVTGAGDALMAGYVHALLMGNPCAALEHGLAAASLAVASTEAVPSTLSAARLAQLVA